MNWFPARIVLLKGDGNGHFDLMHSLPVGQNPIAIVTSDFNRDGLPDLATANLTGNSITVLLNRGEGMFEIRANAAEVGRPRALAAADFDLDGNRDLAATSLADQRVHVLFGDGTGGFHTRTGNTYATTPLTVNTDAAPAVIASADFNADLVPDLAAVNQGASSVAVLLGDGRGGFLAARGSPIAVGKQPTDLAVADLNADGNVDLITVNYESNDVSVLVGNGSAGFSAMTGSPFAAASSPRGVAVADFNGDGKPDLAIANQGGASVSVLRNDMYAPVTVSAATGVSPVAPGSIVSIYGSSLAGAPGSANSTPLPTSLSGATAILSYPSGLQVALPLFYASDGQINAQIPPQAPVGTATLTIFTPSGRQSGTVLLTDRAPGLFTANQNGRGVAAAQLVTPQPNGFQRVTDVFTCPAGVGSCVAVPINVGGDNARLVLYGTGFNNTPPDDVKVTVAWVSLDVEYAGTASFVGGDQINVRLPATLAGSGLVRVTVSAAGTVSNGVAIFIQ